MTDIKLIETGNGGDIKLFGKDLELLQGFGNMIYLAMFGGNPGFSTPSNRVKAQQNFDWWGNSILMPNDPSLQFNSLTEYTLKTVALNSAGRIQIEQAIIKDLGFMRDFATIKVATAITGPDRLRITIQVIEPDNDQATDFVYIWDGTRQDLIPKTESGFITIIPPFEGIEAEGGIITTAGNMKIHTFLTSGNFVVTRGGSLIWLMAGGGGGAGGTNNGGGGGGGAGGLLHGSTVITINTFPIVIGAGGNGSALGNGSPGGNTTFLSLTAFGGGYGGNGSSLGVPGGSGGSGGGASWGSSGGTPAPGVLGQGFEGGLDSPTGFSAGAGGGGATQEGQTPVRIGSSWFGGFGGNGFPSSISGTTIEYAKGGDGGTSFGNSDGAAGIDGRGNGGVGGHTTGGGGKGGNGVVIISYQYRY